MGITNFFFVHNNEPKKSKEINGHKVRRVPVFDP